MVNMPIQKYKTCNGSKGVNGSKCRIICKYKIITSTRHQIHIYKERQSIVIILALTVGFEGYGTSFCGGVFCKWSQKLELHNKHTHKSRVLLRG